MFSKEEKQQLKLSFWERLRTQMEKIKNPFGTKVNWAHYNTHINHLYFRMEADEQSVKLCIDLQFPDSGVREVYWEQFQEFKEMLDELFKQKLIWLKEFEHSNGKTISRIYIEKNDVSILNERDHDKMHLFLKINFPKLDKFWVEYYDVFEALK